MVKVCEICGKDFIVRPSIAHRRFCCSKECGTKRLTNRITINCLQCGCTMEVTPSATERGKKFCSKKCQFLNGHPMLGRKHSEETKKKLSNSHKGQIAWNKGIKTGISSEKQREWARLHWLGNKNPIHKRNITGANHPGWKGGLWKNKTARLRGLKKWKDWREYIFARDNYKCLDCGEGGYLEPHHIIPIRDDETKVFNKDNGITLCRKCHQKTFRKETELINIYKSLIPQF